MFTTLNFWAWVAQILLVAMFGFAGWLKSTQSIDRVAEMTGGWPRDFSPAMVRFIGIVEAAGALGMILPILTGILPWLTPLAAIGFAIIQVLAIGVHARRGETAKTLPINLVLLVVALFVVWARWDLF
ncbi:MAG: DoxX family protein [Devosia sp.]|nr:DoxX family protein [Devosia sp.]